MDGGVAGTLAYRYSYLETLRQICSRFGKMNHLDTDKHYCGETSQATTGRQHFGIGMV